MRPVLRGGESLKVIRCSQAALKKGDIAVMLRSDGALIGHLVVATNPVVTESFAGTPDLPGLEVLARAVAVRRGSTVIPLPRPARFALFGFQRVWSRAAHSPRIRTIHAALVSALASESTARLRQLLGPVEIDVLGPDNLKQFAIALSRWQTLSGDALESLIHHGVVVGAKRQGQIVGCACLTADNIVRHAFLQRRAQGLGLELVMLDRLLREAEDRGLKPLGAEIQPSQSGFVAAVEAFGLPAWPRSATRYNRGARAGDACRANFVGSSTSSPLNNGPPKTFALPMGKRRW